MRTWVVRVIGVLHDRSGNPTQAKNCRSEHGSVPITIKHTNCLITAVVLYPFYSSG